MPNYLDTLLQVASEDGISRERLEEYVQEKYLYLFNNGLASGILDLASYIGIPVSEDTAQKVYTSLMHKLFMRREPTSDELVAFGEWQGLLKFPVSEEAINQALKLIVEHHPENLKIFMQELKVKPSQEFLDPYYKSYFLNGRLTEAKKLEEMTGVPPSRQAISSLLEYLRPKER